MPIAPIQAREAENATRQSEHHRNGGLSEALFRWQPSSKRTANQRSFQEGPLTSSGPPHGRLAANSEAQGAGYQGITPQNRFAFPELSAVVKPEIPRTKSLAVVGTASDVTGPRLPLPLAVGGQV